MFYLIMELSANKNKFLTQTEEIWTDFADFFFPVKHF